MSAKRGKMTTILAGIFGFGVCLLAICLYKRRKDESGGENDDLDSCHSYGHDLYLVWALRD